MHILIVEDEPVAARGLERLVRELLGPRASSVRIEKTLTGGLLFLADNPVDLLLLDLNLNGEDGFDILREITAESFQTVVVSGNTDRALEAFTCGVLDFVPKPVSEERLHLALLRFTEGYKERPRLRFLSIKKDDTLELLPMEKILCFEGADNYVIIHMKNGDKEKTRKTLDYLEKILPPEFIRLHRSYIADSGEIKHFRVRTGGKYTAVMNNGSSFPVSRNRYQMIRNMLSMDSESG